MKEEMIWGREKGMMEEGGGGDDGRGRGRGRGPSPFPHPFPLIPSSSPPISTIFTSPIHFHPLSHPLHPLFHSFSSSPSPFSPFSIILFLSHIHSHPLLIHSTVLGMKSKRPWVRSWVVGMGILGHGYPGPNPYPYP